MSKNSNLLYHQLESELLLLPANTIVMNGGYVEHYTKHPGQFIFGILSLFSGIASGLLSVPSLMSLSQLDKDSSKTAIFAQHPGLMIMGACSAIAQANFLLSDFVRVHGQIYDSDYKKLYLLKNTFREFLSGLDLVNFKTNDLKDDNFINAFEIQLHQLASSKILELVNIKNSSKVGAYQPSNWFEELEFSQWRSNLSSRVEGLRVFDQDLYQILDKKIKSVWYVYYQPFQLTMLEFLNQNDLSEKEIHQFMVDHVKALLSKFNLQKDSVFRSQIIKLYEPFMHDRHGDYIEKQTIIKKSKQVGVFLSYLNVAVNVLIGLGAFFALGQFIFWLGGGSLSIFTVTGVTGWAIKIAFAGLCAIGSYLVTRLDIQEAFNRLGYQLTIWLQSKSKWQDLWVEMKKPRNIFTISATLPAAVGIGIINALGFYLAFKASPIVLALAVVVFLSTMVAIITMMGKRLYASYPRWCFYMSDLYHKRSAIFMNICIVGAIITMFLLNAKYVPVLFAFWTITPFSSFLLILCAATVLFSFLMSATHQWRWHVSFKGSIGSICVFASMVTVFTALLPITGASLAAFIAVSSSILFFSFYVSSVMVKEDNEREFIVKKLFSAFESNEILPMLKDSQYKFGIKEESEVLESSSEHDLPSPGFCGLM